MSVMSPYHDLSGLGAMPDLYLSDTDHANFQLDASITYVV